MLSKSESQTEMTKSVYSLVLTDEIVAKIDRLAYRKNTNRSNMINQILAEYVSFVTPEKRMRDVFGRIETILTGSEDFQMPARPSESMMNLRSAIAYKYNPTVRYSVELCREEGGEIGTLRVQLRTQNENLILLMTDFCRIWTSLETAALGDVDYEIASGRFLRRLVLRENGSAVPGALSADTVGELIANYVRAFDSALKAYFYELNRSANAAETVRSIFAEYVSRSRLIL